MINAQVRTRARKPGTCVKCAVGLWGAAEPVALVPEGGCGRWFTFSVHRECGSPRRVPGLQVDEQRAGDVALVVRLVEEDVLAVPALQGRTGGSWLRARCYAPCSHCRGPAGRALGG